VNGYSERSEEELMTLKHADRQIALRDDLRPTERTCVEPAFGRSHTTRGFILACLAIIGLVLGPSAGAGEITLNFSNVAGADIEIKGSGTGATVQFNNNHSGHGFIITGSNGPGDSNGLFGTLGGTYSYNLSDVTVSGGEEKAPLTSTGGILTITDRSMHELTGTIAGISLNTFRTQGSFNVDGDINLTSVSYSGTNKDLIELRNLAAGGGVVSLTFPLVPARTLTGLAANGSDVTSAYAGTIFAVPEPSSLLLLAVGALPFLGYAARRRRSRIPR
jgi:hypothetical protein